MEPIQSMTIEQYLDLLASGDAVPGGGAAAALTGAQGAALLSMVLAVTAKDGKVAVPEAITQELHAIRQRLLDLATEDAHAFEKVMAAYKLPSKTDATKQAKKVELQAALKGAAHVPMTMLQEMVRLFPTFDFVAKVAKPTIASDAALAIHLVHAAMKGAHYNVRINLKYIDDKTFVNVHEGQLDKVFAGRKSQRKALLKLLTSHF